MKTPTITQGQLASALTEWDRRWREDPAQFLSDAERLSVEDAGYGVSSAAYIFEIMEEQKIAP